MSLSLLYVSQFAVSHFNMPRYYTSLSCQLTACLSAYCVNLLCLLVCLSTYSLSLSLSLLCLSSCCLSFSLMSLNLLSQFTVSQLAICLSVYRVAHLTSCLNLSPSSPSHLVSQFAVFLVFLSDSHCTRPYEH